MAELREIKFDHRLVSGRVAFLYYTGHDAVVSYHEDGTAYVTCTCRDSDGKLARWRHHPHEDQQRTILHVFNAHLSFATRQKTRVD